MAKTTISNGDLAAIFYEKIKGGSDCPTGIAIAIVPVKSTVSGWMALTNPGDRIRHPLCARHIEAIQKQLREVYNLARD